MTASVLAFILLLFTSFLSFAQEFNGSKNGAGTTPLDALLDGKNRLENYGLSAGFVYTGEYFDNLRGGINTSGAGEYRGDLSIYLELDTETAGWWDGGTFFAHLQEQHGQGITEDHVGDFQVLSNIDAGDFKQVSELWYRHGFLDNAYWIKVGKMEANEDFAGMDFGTEFIHSGAGFAPTIPLATFPDQDWGIVFGASPVDWLSVNAGLYIWDGRTAAA